MENPACPSKQLPGTSPTKLKGIKPKPEPCDDDLPPPPASKSDEDWEATTPLGAGNPFFSIVMSRSHVEKKFQMLIPARFYHLLPEERTSAVLRCGGKSWLMSYCGELKQKKFDAAWADFAVDNRLRVGDACVFELILGAAGSKQEENMTAVFFQVQILRGGLPPEVTSKGATFNEPIVIFD